MIDYFGDDGREDSEGFGEGREEIACDAGSGRGRLLAIYSIIYTRCGLAFSPNSTEC